MRLVAALMVLTMAAMSAASAQTVGDVLRGHGVAERLCAECHGIESGSIESPFPAVATFVTIARTPGMSEMALRVWLRTTHNEMPNLMLNAQERDDIVAYILSLK